jgi:hypothetical protein
MLKRMGNPNMLPGDILLWSRNTQVISIRRDVLTFGASYRNRISIQPVTPS